MISLSFSSRKNLRKCPKKFKLRKMYPRYQFYKSTEVGNAVHKLQELTISQPLAQLYDLYGKWRSDRERLYTPEDLPAIQEAHNKALPIWRAYNWGADTLEPRTREILAAEHRFQHELVPGGWSPGIIDQIAMLDVEGTLLPFIGDYKTTGINIADYAAMLLKSDQGPLYLLWARSKAFVDVFPDVPAPVGVFFDIIAVPKLRQKKTETWEQFDHRLYREIIDNYSTRVVRIVHRPTDMRLAATIQKFSLDVKTLEGYIAADFFPECSDNCIDMGKLCEYYEDCDASDPQDINLRQLIQIEGSDTTEHESNDDE